MGLLLPSRWLIDHTCRNANLIAYLGFEGIAAVLLKSQAF